MSIEDAIKVSDQFIKTQDHAFELEAKRARLEVELIKADLDIELLRIFNANQLDKHLAMQAARDLAMKQVREIHKARTVQNRRLKNFENWKMRAERLLLPELMESKHVLQSWNAWFKLISLWPTEVKTELGKILVPKNVKDKRQFKFHRKKKPTKFRGRSAMALWRWCRDNGVTVHPGTKAMDLFHKTFKSFGKAVGKLVGDLKTDVAAIQEKLDEARDEFIKENLPAPTDLAAPQGRESI